MNRKKFFQFGVSSIMLLFIFLWERLSDVNNKLSQHQPKVLLFNKNKQVAFFEDFIVVNKDDKTKVFNSHCTHLGCTINKMENGLLVCPCHGSQFSLDGSPVKGPAFKPLKSIPARISSDGRYIHLKE